MTTFRNRSLVGSSFALAAGFFFMTDLAAAKRIEAKDYVLDTSASECKIGAECTAIVKLEALGAYHINKEFPYKLEMEDAEGVEFTGKGKRVFTRANGDFTSAQEKSGEMKVSFKASKAGDLVLKGKYKMSVCSDKDCQLQTQLVTIEVKSKR